jgi:four helix bundle protein
MENLNFEPTVLLKVYQFYRQFYRLSFNFPKISRYTIGEKILNCQLDLMELISLANIQIKTLREPFLHRASAKCELLKLLLRLCYDLSLTQSRQYVELEAKTKEIGKMLGGWIKFSRTQ